MFFSRKKSRFHLLKAFFTKMGRCKTCRWQLAVLLFRAMIFRLWKQNLPLKQVRSFTRWLPIDLELKTMLARASERENFSRKSTKFAVERDWSSESSETVHNLEVFWKNRWVFYQKQSLNFSKSLNVKRYSR